MAEGVNKVILLGNLGADPELRSTQGGESVLRIRLATTESYLDRNKERKERTEWHSVTVWGKRGEALSRLLTKGSSVYIEGGLRTSSYDDKDGKTVYRTEIVAQNIVLTGNRPGGGARPAPEGGHDTPPAAQRPAGGARPAAKPAADAHPSDEDDGYSGSSDDDIPF